MPAIALSLRRCWVLCQVLVRWLHQQHRSKGSAISTKLDMAHIITEHPPFFTATILEWKKLLQLEKYKNIIISSMQFLVQDKRVIIYGFVIMNNHMHLIGQMQTGRNPEEVQRDFLKFTAQKIKADLQKNHPEVVRLFQVHAKDRKYQFWERNPLSVEIGAQKV